MVPTLLSFLRIGVPKGLFKATGRDNVGFMTNHLRTRTLASLTVVLSLAVAPLAHAKDKAKKADAKPKNHSAVILTTAGKIEVKLFDDIAPKTVENFIALSKGTKAWTDPATGKEVKGKPLYNGTIFHRVIPGFMIQGGDPAGNGTGGPGYQFEDEFSDSQGFDRPGVLAMANAGPGTNGSQFFITAKPTPWLNHHHTIFGEVTKGMDVVDKIINAPRGQNDRPEKPVSIKKITIK
jgi:peptidyl-prolyl cis-trans isomerase A (cyclophilin A)